jgi:hypothetical protein
MTTISHPLSMSLALLEWKIYTDFEHSLHSYVDSVHVDSVHVDSVHVDSFGVIMMMHESLLITEISILVCSCGQGSEIGGSPSAVAEHLVGSKDVQPSIDVEEDDNESTGVEEEDELSTDQIRATRKVNSIAIIEALCLKPSSLSRMRVPLCRMVAMPIVRSTLSSDLASLEDDYVHGYREGAVVFYLSITNEVGQIEKVSDEDLASWGPYWRAVKAQFEEFLSSVPGLRDLKDVKFSVFDGNHRRQAWMNVISRLHSIDPS